MLQIVLADLYQHTLSLLGGKHAKNHVIERGNIPPTHEFRYKNASVRSPHPLNTIIRNCNYVVH